MTIRIVSNKQNGTVVVHADATGTIVVAGNNSVSNIASGAEIINGATIRRVIHGANSGGQWVITRGSNTVGVYVNSGEINYAALGMPQTLDPAANVTFTLTGGAGSIMVELAKQCNNYPSTY